MRDVLFCPGCQRRLQLPDEAYGKSVQCPSCQRVFIAEAALQSTPAASAPKPAASTPARPTIDYDSRNDDDRPRPKRRDDDDGRRYSPRRPVPHRGGEILTFGLLAVLPCPLTSIIFGLIAWMMANADLGEMRSGRMDRDGEGLTQAGRALGIIGIVLWIVVFGCLGLSSMR